MNTHWLARTAPLLLGFLALATPPAHAQDPAAQLDAYVARTRSDWSVPGMAIAVVRSDGPRLARGYGVRALGGEDQVDEHTLFAIGSTTKAMTAATLGLLVDDGALDWDDRVIEHWPGFRLHDAYVTHEVTVRDLLLHRAGLRDADRLWYGSDRTREEILERIHLIQPAYSLRAGFVYQNIMYLAAGELAARVAETPWEDLLTERLFGPLGMDRSVPTPTAAERSENVARPHGWIDDRVEEIENETLDSIAPAGSVWSSVSDMSRWIRMLLSGGELEGRRVLSEAVVAELLRPQTLLDLTRFYPYLDRFAAHWTSYSLGWFQLDYRGRAVFFHSGSIDGMAAMVGIVPDEDLGIVVLENLDHAELRHALLWKAIDLFTDGGDDRDWSAELKTFYDEHDRVAAEGRAQQEALRREGTSPSLPLERYAGRYVHELYGTVEVIVSAGGLRLVEGPRRTADLEHWHFDAFRANYERRWQGATMVTFSLDAQGEPARLDAGGVDFRRMRED